MILNRKLYNILKIITLLNIWFGNDTGSTKISSILYKIYPDS